jgi:hypothetical protein
LVLCYFTFTQELDSDEDEVDEVVPVVPTEVLHEVDEVAVVDVKPAQTEGRKQAESAYNFFMKSTG